MSGPSYDKGLSSTLLRPMSDIALSTYVRTYVRRYVRTYVRAYVRTYARTYVRTYLRTYVRTYVLSAMSDIGRNNVDDKPLSYDGPDIQM